MKKINLRGGGLNLFFLGFYEKTEGGPKDFFLKPIFDFQKINLTLCRRGGRHSSPFTFGTLTPRRKEIFSIGFR